MSAPTIEACMAFTEVFRTVRIEHTLSLGVGLVIGMVASWLHNR